MFKTPASVKVVVKKPVPLPQVLEQTLIQIESPFSSSYNLENSCKTSIDQLVVACLRNGVITLAIEVLFFLGTSKKESINFKRTQGWQQDRSCQNLLYGVYIFPVKIVLSASNKASKASWQERSIQNIISSLRVDRNFEMLMYIFALIDLTLNIDSFIDS